uniref:Uncharacterized protein n=1 Tax=Bursaphelenchus xylophilus TaxID=6326 RepID=A0A1I7S6T3_BURXY
MTNAPRLNERILSFFVQHYVRNGEPIFERVVNTTLVRIIFLHRRYIKCLPFLQNSKKSQVELVIRGSELLCALFNEWRTANENGKLLIMMINRLYEHVRDLRYKIFVSHAVRPRMKLVYQVGRALKRLNL